MYGYWRATVQGREVARGNTLLEALEAAGAMGYASEEIIVEFVYESARA